MLRYWIFFFCFLAFWGGKRLQAQYIAYFEIKNEQRIGSTYHFDIFMQASPDSSYLSRGLMYVYYNTRAFGSGPPVSFVTPTKGDLIDDLFFGSNKYNSNPPVPNGNRFAITVSSAFSSISPPDPAFHSMVPDTPITMFHIAMTMSDSTQCPCIALDGNLMAGEQYYFNKNFNPSLPVDSATNPQEIRYGVGVLPASINSFSAKITGSRETELLWTTSLEYQSDFFLLEKRSGKGDFQPLARVDASGMTESLTSYRYIDPSPLEGRVYYRLKQVNTDGSYKYSRIVELQAPFDKQISVYPNPAEEEVFVEGISGEQQTLSFSLSDIAGREIQTGVKSVEEGDYVFPVSLKGLTSGTYLLRIQSSRGQTLVRKVTKK